MRGLYTGVTPCQPGVQILFPMQVMSSPLCFKIYFLSLNAYGRMLGFYLFETHTLYLFCVLGVLTKRMQWIAHFEI